MPLKKFGDNDIFHNTLQTFPRNQFDIYQGSVYYQNESRISGAFTGSVPCVPTGFVSLYELNVDRAPLTCLIDADCPPGYTCVGGICVNDEGLQYTGLIYPLLYKDSSLTTFKSVSTSSWNAWNAATYGSVFTGSYPLSATISREYLTQSIPTAHPLWPFTSSLRITALRSAMSSYTYWSPYYQFNSSSPSYGDWGTKTPINLISIPSIFYGSSINKENGSVSLKYYVSGSLIGELRDSKRNGELIQVGPSGSVGTGSVAGIILYNEGFILLTGSWGLEPLLPTRNYKLAAPTTSSWLMYGAGMNDNSGSNIPFVNYRMEFEGVNYIETITMLAHAEKGEINHSNNPTYLEFDPSVTTASQFQINSSMFRETPRTIKNVVKSPYVDPTASFEKTTYISKVGIYDKEENLIGIATVSKPVKKTLSRDFTFKLKVDLQ